jgi:hypothetical protein
MIEFLEAEKYADDIGDADVREYPSLDGLNYIYDKQDWPLEFP